MEKTKFYWIKLYNILTKKDGYLVESNNQVMVSNEPTSDIKQFDTYQLAQQYMVDNKLEGSYVKAYINDNEALMKLSSNVRAIRPNEILYTVVNLQGEHMFYDTNSKKYFWSKREVGYIFFQNIKQADDFIKQMEFNYEVKIIEIK